MNTLTDSPQSARYSEGYICIVLQSGGTLRFPVSGNPRLEAGTPVQLNHIVLSPFGLHWPDLDEDLSLEGIRAGRYGQILNS